MDDFSIDEIESFYNTLPDECATLQSFSKLEVDLKTYFNALLIDAISGLHTGMAGKKMKDKNRIAKALIKTEKKRTTKASRQSSAVKARKKRLAREAEENGNI